MMNYNFIVVKVLCFQNWLNHQIIFLGTIFIFILCFIYCKNQNFIYFRYAIKYFKNRSPPFQESSTNQEYPIKKLKTNHDNTVEIITELLVVKTCYNLLSCDPVFFKNHWNWSYFIENYCWKGCDLQKIYCNYILGYLMNMTISQIEEMNDHLSTDVKIAFNNEIGESDNKLEKFNDTVENIDDDCNENEKKICWNYSNNIFINIENVMLPIYNIKNAEFYRKTDGNYDRIVKVKSTSNNLRSIALGILSDKAICLNGPVGCGKTTLIEYLARKTGRICPKENEIRKYYNNEIHEEENNSKQQKTQKQLKGIKRKSLTNNVDKEKNKKIIENGNGNGFTGEKGGFLRIQLGDQIDSKMILGQYK